MRHTISMWTRAEVTRRVSFRRERGLQVGYYKSCQKPDPLLRVLYSAKDIPASPDPPENMYENGIQFLSQPAQSGASITLPSTIYSEIIDKDPNGSPQHPQENIAHKRQEYSYQRTATESVSEGRPMGVNGLMKSFVCQKKYGVSWE